jgi:hypothetical protein
MIKVSWKGTDDDSIFEKECDSKITLRNFIESLNNEELSSFKQRFKYGFQIKIETI